MNNAALVRLFPPPIDKFRNFFEPPNSRGRNEASPNSAAFRQEDRPSRFHWRLLNLFSCFDKRVTERLDHLLGDIMADLSMQAPRGGRSALPDNCRHWPSRFIENDPAKSAEYAGESPCLRGVS